MQEILIITIIVIVLVIIVFILLSRLIKMINEDSKLYYLAKLQVYDDLIEEKERKVSEINNEKKDNEGKNITEKNEGIKEADKGPAMISSTTSLPVNYEIENLNSLLNEIENDFNYDNEKIVKMFLERASLISNNEYLMLENIKRVIEDYGIFEIATASAERQAEIMRELKIDDNWIFKETYKDRFDINEFMKKLDSALLKNDPHIYVYVGNKYENYDGLNEYVKTIFDEDILKGVIIKYKGCVFDYSLV